MLSTLERGRQMRRLKYKKSVVLDRIKANKVKHVQDYHEAIEGYRDQILATLASGKNIVSKKIQELEDKVAAITIENFKAEQLHIDTNSLVLRVPMPKSYENDYEQVIQQLELCVEDELDLDQDEFARFMMDKWDWKDQFAAVTEVYAAAKKFKG